MEISCYMYFTQLKKVGKGLYFLFVKYCDGFETWFSFLE